MTISAAVGGRAAAPGPCGLHAEECFGHSRAPPSPVDEGMFGAGGGLCPEPQGLGPSDASSDQNVSVSSSLAQPRDHSYEIWIDSSCGDLVCGSAQHQAAIQFSTETSS